MEKALHSTIQDEVLDFLTSSPTPQQIIEFQASDEAQMRLRYLLDGSRSSTLSSDEQTELDEASRINHFFVLLKARAHQTLNSNDLHS